jgi:hypothetical protein
MPDLTRETRRRSSPEERHLLPVVTVMVSSKEELVPDALLPPSLP